MPKPYACRSYTYYYRNGFDNILQPESRQRRPKLPKHHTPYNIKYFYSFLALSFNSIFLTEVAQYECSYGRTAHHATDLLISVAVFTARCYASAVLAMSLCPSVRVRIRVCPSVTSRCSTKTAKRRITQTRPHDTPGTLVF